MKLITWNTQWARGVDGRVDPQRIVEDALELADFDVLCLQEVAANFPALAGSTGENQFEIYARLLPDYAAVPVAGVDLLAEDGTRRVFGNMILSRYPVERVLRHQLPWPRDPDALSMPRTLLEVVLTTPLGPVRVMTTHLEYYSQRQRAAQVERIRVLHTEACDRAEPGGKRESAQSPFQARSEATQTILTGDFNFRPEDPLRARMQEPIDKRTPRLVDTWEHLHPAIPHPHNVGLYDREQWPDPFTCDFIFASENLLPRVRAVRLNTRTAASDHQPQALELE